MAPIVPVSKIFDVTFHDPKREDVAITCAKMILQAGTAVFTDANGGVLATVATNHTKTIMLRA